MAGVFDRHVQTAMGWLNDVVFELGWIDDKKTLSLMRAVLHTLRDRMTVEEAIEFGAELPTLIRGIYYEGYDPRGKPERIRTPEQFYAGVQSRLCNWHDPPEQATRAILEVIRRRMTPGEIEDVISTFPAKLKGIFSPPLA